MSSNENRHRYFGLSATAVGRSLREVSMYRTTHLVQISPHQERSREPKTLGTVTGYAGGAKAPVGDLGLSHKEPAAGIIRDGRRRRGARHVPDGLAAYAHEMVVGFRDVGVIALRTLSNLHEAQLAHRNEFIQGVVDGRPADLGQPFLRAFVNLFRSEMHVLTGEHLGNGSALRA